MSESSYQTEKQLIISLEKTIAELAVKGREKSVIRTFGASQLVTSTNDRMLGVVLLVTSYWKHVVQETVSAVGKEAKTTVCVDNAVAAQFYEVWGMYDLKDASKTGLLCVFPADRVSCIISLRSGFDVSGS